MLSVGMNLKKTRRKLSTMNLEELSRTLMLLKIKILRKMFNLKLCRQQGEILLLKAHQKVMTLGFKILLQVP